MIKFFRKIRFKQLKERNMSKYFKYAIGEILLVVIGILIALQINTWRQNSMNRAEEQFYLKKLVNNLANDTLALSQRMESLSQNLQNLERTSKSIRDLNFEFDKQNSVRALTSIIRFVPQTTTFDNLISTGKLQLIRNDSIVEAIIGYYNDIQNQPDQVSDANITLTRGQIQPYILNKPGGYFRQADFNNDFWEEPYFLNIVDFKANLTRGLIAGHGRTKEYAMNLIHLISKEISEK